MSLLFDQNLSPHLVARLAADFPGSLHVRDVGLERATDAEVWQRARLDDLTIDVEGLPGPPPRWIWVRLGNSSTVEVETLLRQHRDVIDAFGDADAVRLELP